MSKLQTIIIPRNWLFGRLCYMRANLRNMIKVNPQNFSVEEHTQLKKAVNILEDVIVKKKENSETLKKIFKNI